MQHQGGRLDAGGSDNNSLALKLTARELQANDLAGFEFYVKAKIDARVNVTAEINKIAIRARAGNDDGLILKISLIDSEGNAFSSLTKLEKTFATKELLFKDFQTDSTLLLPRPYPSFQQLYFRPSIKDPKLNFKNIEKVQVTTKIAVTNLSPEFEVEWIKAMKAD